MKQTMALLDFMAETGFGMCTAIGVIDQLHEMEREGRVLEDMLIRTIAIHLRVPPDEIDGIDLVRNYREYQIKARQELNREYNREYRVRQMQDRCKEDARQMQEKREKKISRKTTRKAGKPDVPVESAPTQFDTFWKAYPRKVNKKEAAKIWERINPTQEQMYVMIADINRRLESREWLTTPDQSRYIPHPSTYLNQQRWEDNNEVSNHAEAIRRADEDEDAGLTEEQIRLFEQFANDGKHWG